MGGSQRFMLSIYLSIPGHLSLSISLLWKEQCSKRISDKPPRSRTELLIVTRIRHCTYPMRARRGTHSHTKVNSEECQAIQSTRFQSSTVMPKGPYTTDLAQVDLLKILLLTFVFSDLASCARLMWKADDACKIIGGSSGRQDSYGRSQWG